MMYSAYKLNKQGDNKQPCHIPFPILNQSIVPCKVLILASWPSYKFLRRQVRWSDGPISLKIFHSLLWSIVKVFSIVRETEVDVFLEFPCFLYDRANVDNLISGSSANVDNLISGSSAFSNYPQRCFLSNSFFPSMNRPYFLISLCLHIFIGNWVFQNWKIIALQCCVGFCHTTMQTSYKYIYIYIYINIYIYIHIYIYPFPFEPPSHHPSSQPSKTGDFEYSTVLWELHCLHPPRIVLFVEWYHHPSV